MADVREATIEDEADYSVAMVGDIVHLVSTEDGETDTEVNRTQIVESPDFPSTEVADADFTHTDVDVIEVRL